MNAVCPICTRPVALGQDYCDRCGTAVGTFTSTQLPGQGGTRAVKPWIRGVAHVLLFPVGVLVALWCRIKRAFRR